jgi:trans-aconitate methyltransferase
VSWKDLCISPEATHHERDGKPAYAERFDEVLAFHEPGLAPVVREHSSWHILPDASPAYPHRFQRTFGFYEGLATVTDADGWHHITPTGTRAYTQNYDWCGNFQGGRCTVRDTDGYHHIRADGAPAYVEQWAYAGDYRDGIAVVQAKDGYSTHIDRDGNLIHGVWLLDLDVYHKGFARARDEGGWMHVKRNGQPIYRRRFAAVEPFYNGQARVECHDGGLEVIDERGGALRRLRLPLQSEFSALSADMVGFWRTQTIATAVELGVFEVLPATTHEIAVRCNLWPERVPRLLYALSELQLVNLDGEHWQPTQRGDYLRANNPLTLSGAARDYADIFTSLWQKLPSAMRQDGSWTPPDIFSDLAADKDRYIPHHRSLASYARHDYIEVPAGLELSGMEHVIDVGGGLGTLSVAILNHYPKAQVTLLDRPEVIELARAQLVNTPGLTLLAANFFEPWKVQADAVVLTRVLHDWCNEDAIRILQRARGALQKGGKLFVVEMLRSEHNDAGSLCDLHLLMATGGQERTRNEYRKLFEQAGFALAKVKAQASLTSILVGEAQ